MGDGSNALVTKFKMRSPRHRQKWTNVNGNREAAYPELSPAIPALNGVVRSNGRSP